MNTEKDTPRLGGIRNQYNALPKKIQDYFPYLPDLIESYPYIIAFSYLFYKMELAHTMALYCGLRKHKKVDIELADIAVNNTEMDREKFRKFFETVFDKKFPKRLIERVDNIQKIRNKIFHGKDNFSDAQVRREIVNIMNYAKEFNQDMKRISGFEPFGKLRGVPGKSKPHNKDTSRLLLKGMGFDIG